MNNKTLYFSSMLRSDNENLKLSAKLKKLINEYGLPESAEDLFTKLDDNEIPYAFIENTSDIWARDYMPVEINTGAYVSFRYDPSYLDKEPRKKTNYRKDISSQLPLPEVDYSEIKDLCEEDYDKATYPPKVIYSDINLDGGNVEFSPSKNKVIISRRVYLENPSRDKNEIVKELERLLKAEVIIIPSYDEKDEYDEYIDMTGHADGMVRFVDEDTVVGNDNDYDNELEKEIIAVLNSHGIEVIDFPYLGADGSDDSDEGSAVGLYMNFYKADNCIILPEFGIEMDDLAEKRAEDIFKKPVVRTNINGIAEHGGVLNCISWER